MNRFEYTDEEGDKIILTTSHGGGSIIEIGTVVASITPRDAPDFALHILEAAGHDAMTEGPIGEAISGLRAYRFADMEAEADRNALESEAQRLFEAFKEQHPRPGFFAWNELNPAEKDYWRDITVAARRIYQDSAA